MKIDGGLSPKQREVFKMLKKGEMRRINIFEGSVRSGKTYISMIIWGFWVAGSPKNKAYLMAGKTLRTLKRNVLDPMSEIFGSAFSYNIYKKEADLFGRKVYLESAANADSENKLRGMTLMGAYCDELTLFSESFFTMLLSRLSERGAKVFATTNPDDPDHWLKRNYIDNKKANLLSIKFKLEDNVFLPEEYIRQLRNEFHGVFYDRFILGKWTKAEGRIYDGFSAKNIIGRKELNERLNHKKLILSVVGVDYGGSGSASAFAHVGFDEEFSNVYVLSEYYDKENRSAENLISAFSEFVQREKERFPTLSRAYCDSAEQLLVKSFRRAVRIEVSNAKKRPINTRINMLNRLIASGRFYVVNECRRTIDAIGSAVWDEHYPSLNKRLDNGTSNIDSLDALEYAIERFENQLFKF